MNEDNILISVKASLGLPADYDPFDAEIIMNINTVLSIVNQLGVGKYGYEISAESPGSWDEFLEEEILDAISINAVIPFGARVARSQPQEPLPRGRTSLRR